MKVLLVLCCALVAHSQAQTMNLAEKATELGLTTLVQYLTTAGLADTIATGGPFTVFGPTNAAFDALSDEVKEELTNDVNLLSSVLQYHVLNGKVMSTDLSDELLAASLEGTNVRINIYSKDGSSVITATGSQVTGPNEEATNGVIHVVDTVMMPPSGTVTDYVVGAASFSTLLAAVTAAGLGDTLAGAGPFTVFAPTNDAFSKIPSADLDALLADKDKLTAVLLMHVVGDTVYSKGLSATQTVQTLNTDEEVTVVVNSNGVTVNGVATVEIADVSVTNGVIHAIDTVLMPADSGATKTSVLAFSTLLSFIVMMLLR